LCDTKVLIASQGSFGWLAKAYEEGSADLIEIAVEPAFAGLRSDPRFRDLVRRIGLTASAGMTGS
jgi:hypothetical protein